MVGLFHPAMGVSCGGLAQFGWCRQPFIILILVSKSSVPPELVRMGKAMRHMMLLSRTFVEISARETSVR